MTDKNQTITNKMEDFFLSILRGVILFVLAGSILAAIYFAISGATDLGAKPKDYTYEKFDSKQLSNDLKDKLSPKAAPAPNTPPAPPPVRLLYAPAESDEPPAPPFLPFPPSIKVIYNITQYII